MFNANGEPRAILTTPTCQVAEGGKEIFSADALMVRQGNGPAQVQGEGFYFNLVTRHLIISNHVHGLLPYWLPTRVHP